jgi:methylmalonyl-CoA/ethylmalonyl-CoA epimerase
MPPMDEPASIASIPPIPRSLAPLVRSARLDHVAVAVRDLASAAALYRDVLGAEFLMGGDVEGQGFRFVQYRWPGGGKIELVMPIEDGFVSRFIDRRGEGVHHVTFRVDALEEQVTRIQEAGVPLTLVSFDNPYWKEAFVHPDLAHGVLIQLAESPYSEDESARHFAVRFPEAVLLTPIGLAPPPTDS